MSEVEDVKSKTLMVLSLAQVSRTILGLYNFTRYYYLTTHCKPKTSKLQTHTCMHVCVILFISGLLKPGANESKKTRNKKQETKRFSTFAVYRLRHSETKKNIA